MKYINKSYLLVLGFCFTCSASVWADGVLTPELQDGPIFQSGIHERVQVKVREIFEQSDSMEQLEIRAEMQRLGLSESAMDSAAVVVSPQEVTVVGLDPSLNESHLAYFGVRLGFPFFLGLSVMYRNINPETLSNRIHLEFEAATAAFVNTLNLAFGIHPGGGSFYFGARVHNLYVIPVFSEGRKLLGIGPEIGWLLDLDQKKTWVATIRLGALGASSPASPGYVILPDIKVGIAVKLFGL